MGAATYYTNQVVEVIMLINELPYLFQSWCAKSVWIELFDGGTQSALGLCVVGYGHAVEPIFHRVVTQHVPVRKASERLLEPRNVHSSA